ncbi:MAG: NF038122 family metalloprotease [Stellaceae bacterium]
MAVLALSKPADALVITPDFESSITGSVGAAQIEGAIDTAIGTIDGLYSPNNVSITVNFSYTPGAPGNLLSTSEEFYGYSYSAYTNALKADAAANPSNTNLATAVANLSKGNDSNGASGMAIAYAQALLLADYGLAPPSFVADASININSNQLFDFTRPVPSSEFDAIGGLEHELDEVLGGGGAGSTLNEILNNCTTNPTNFFCGKFGPTDLYRYSAPGTPSFTTSGTATSYLSIDGGLTDIVDLNQNSGGDYGDFAPPGTGAGQLIQNAFNSTGQDEAYTTSSPEFLMEEAIGWDSTAEVVVSEPGTLALLGSSLLGLTALRRRRRI